MQYNYWGGHLKFSPTKQHQKGRLLDPPTLALLPVAPSACPPQTCACSPPLPGSPSTPCLCLNLCHLLLALPAPPPSILPQPSSPPLPLTFYSGYSSNSGSQQQHLWPWPSPVKQKQQCQLGARAEGK